MALDSGSDRNATVLGIRLKHVSLILLTCQNSALILIMHYSRVMSPVNGQRYFASTAVFLCEVIKLTLSLTVSLYDMSKNLSPSSPATTLFRNLSAAVFTGDSWKLAIPAMLYTLQNSLQYIAVSNLDAATFQVTYQLKILTTALFSVRLLGRFLSTRKWAALLLLTLGVAIVQIPGGAQHGVPADMDTLKGGAGSFYMPRTLEQLRDLGSSAAAALLPRSATYEGIEDDYAMHHPRLNGSLGLAAVVCACMLSGLAGVYFEKVLKDPNATASLWIRNVQLSFFSMFPALFLGVVFKDGEAIAKAGFFAGYNWIVWLAVAFQALGGLTVALVVNYADNIAKNFATSISIVISFLAGVLFFDVEIATNFVIGTAIVLFSTYLYAGQDRLRLPPISVVEYQNDKTGHNHDRENDMVIQMPPVGADGLSTSSRPGTPQAEKNNYSFRAAAGRRQFGKRDA